MAGRADNKKETAEVKARYDGMHGEMFNIMREESIYRFDLDATTVEAVIDTPEEGK